MRTVFDTNVAVSAALLPHSIPRQAFDRARESGKYLVSEATLNELDEVLRRQKFDRYLPEQIRLEFLLSLIERAEVVPVTCQISICRDPKDNKFLELAMSGDATHIVTGDADLLTLHFYQGIQIVSPADFMAISASE
jgi:uncharacterized protein